jgi:hypothetical protein
MNTPVGSPKLFIGVIFLVVGLSFLGAGIVRFNADRRFADEGRTTQGTVLTKAIRTERDRDGSRTQHYEATYRFAVQGETLEGRDELTRDGWERLTEGGPVDVLYLPSNPASNRLAGSRSWARMIGLIGLIFTAVGAATLVRAIRQTRLETRLQQHGISSKGVITELCEGPLTINDVPQWRLQYAFEDFQGRRHLNTVDLPEAEARQWKVGEVGLVRYDSARPAEAVWLGRIV